MQSDQSTTLERVTPEPYTFARHTQLCHDASLVDAPPPDHVQVLKAGVVYCSQIKASYTTRDGVDLWVLDAHHYGLIYATPRNVSQCARLDGRCVCSGEA